MRRECCARGNGDENEFKLSSMAGERSGLTRNGEIEREAEYAEKHTEEVSIKKALEGGREQN